MRKSTKLSFEKTFAGLYEKGWDTLSFDLNKADARYLLDNDYISGHSENGDYFYYNISDETAWKRLLEIYADKVKYLEYKKELDEHQFKLSKKYLTEFHRISYKTFGEYPRDIIFLHNYLYILVVNETFRGEENFTTYPSRISSHEELDILVARYKLCDKANREFNSLYKQYIEEFETEQDNLKEKYGIE